MNPEDFEDPESPRPEAPSETPPPTAPRMEWFEPNSADLAAELIAFRGSFDDAIAGLGRRLDEFSHRLANSFKDWERAQDAERADLNARLEAQTRERAALAHAWETQARGLREDQFQDRAARDAEVARKIDGLASRLTELVVAQKGAASLSDSMRSGLERVLELLTTPTKSNDVVLAEVEKEKAELLKIARDRQEALRVFAEERREVEKSLGDGLVKLTGQIESERARVRAAEARAAEISGATESLKLRLEDLERGIADRDARARQLGAERDELARALVAEADKVRRGLEERREAEAAADARMAELRKRLDEETERRASAEAAAIEARGQMSALAEQTARSLQERDSTLARFSDWERERQRLQDLVRKKEEMVSLLSTTFETTMKKAF